MERKFVMFRKLADALIERIEKETLPIEVHQGREYVDCHGDRQVNVLLVCEDPDLIGEVINDVMHNTLIFD